MNILKKLLLRWRLSRVDVNSYTKRKKFPLGYQIVRNGRRYIYCKKEQR